MKEAKVGKHRVSLYNSIEELPMVRFHKFNKCLLIDAGIGSDLTAVDAHIERAVRYIKDDKRSEAATEMENLRQNIFMVLQGLSPSNMAFACLVKSVDGKPQDDLSDEGLINVLSLLGEITQKELAALQDAVKKKIDNELTMYFPNIFDDSRSKEFYDKMRERTLLQLEAIIKGKNDEREKAIERLTNLLVTYSKPKKFVGNGNAEIEYDRQFEDMCLLIGQNLNRNAKKFTVMEYFNAYNYIKEQTKHHKTKNKAL